MLLLALQQGGLLLCGFGIAAVGQVEREAFLFQTAFARFVLLQGVLRVGQLLLFQSQFAFDAVVFVLLALVGGVEGGLRFFQLGQAFFVFGHLHGGFGQLSLFFFDVNVGFFKQGADLLLLLVDARKLYLCGGFVALDALVQGLPVADLLFQAGNLFA